MFKFNYREMKKLINVLFWCIVVSTQVKGQGAISNDWVAFRQTIDIQTKAKKEIQSILLWPVLYYFLRKWRI